jgi:integrase/recombinase XerC
LGTVYGRRRYLSRLASDVDLATVSGDELLAWLAGHGWAPETRRSAREALMLYFRWATKRGLRADDPTADLPTTRVPPPCPHPATDSVLSRARLAATDEQRLMVDLAALAGLRRAEIAGLPATALEDDDCLRILGKGDRVRVVPVSPELAARIRARGGPWVFPGRFAGTHTCPDRVGRTLSRLLGPGWTGHSLRHRFATRAYRGTHDLLAVQSLMGHGDPATTQAYVEVPRDDLRAAVLAAAS